MAKINELEAEVRHLRESLRAEQEEVARLKKYLQEMAEDHEAELASQRKYVEEAYEAIELYGYAFGIRDHPTKQGSVQSDHADLLDKHNKLVRDYNSLVKEWNTRFGHWEPQGPGRPLMASKDQAAKVIKLRKAGAPLRGIADETGLSLQTVRTILARPTKKAAKRRHEQDRLRAAEYRARKRAKDKLVKDTKSLLDRGKTILTKPST